MAHAVVSQNEWLDARKALLAKEKEFTQAREALAAERRDLPWVKIDKPYVFDGPQGRETLAELFAGKSQLIVYHFMLAPGWGEGCKSCSYVADHFDGAIPHLAQRDVSMLAISRAPLAEIEAYKNRMGWKFKWLSSNGNDFNYDFNGSYTEKQQREGSIEYNYEREEALEWRAGEEGGGEGPVAEMAATTGTDVATYTREGPGMSAFVLDGGAVYHTYSTYARGLDGLWGMYQWLDRAPKGRNEAGGVWWRRRDEYDRA